MMLMAGTAWTWTWARRAALAAPWVVLQGWQGPAAAATAAINQQQQQQWQHALDQHGLQAQQAWVLSQKQEVP